MEFILFINEKKCWHLNSIFKIGEFLHVNKKTFYIQDNILVFMVSWTYNVAARFFRKSQKCKFGPDLKRRCVRDDPFLCLQNIGAGKYRTRRRLRPFSAQLQTKDDICMAPQGIIYMSKLKNTHEMKYVWLSIKFNYFVLPASVGVSSVATQFHVSNSDGRMSKGVKTSQRCEWLIVTSRNVSSKINVKPSKVQIPISFLIIWIFWSNKNEFTRHMMTCLKITESQNVQIYPEDTFSHGAAHVYKGWDLLYTCKLDHTLLFLKCCLSCGFTIMLPV